MVYVIPTLVTKHAVANKLEKRSLLIAVNAVACLSIFFFGYDQGLMGGVNTTRHYATTMGFGEWDTEAGLVRITRPLLQGGIVSVELDPSIQIILTTKVAVYYLPGTLVGAFWGGWLGDRYGRITTIGFGAVWTIIGAVLQSSAQNASWMFCGE
jgi:MFS family permease